MSFKITMGELIDRLSIVYRKKFYGGEQFQKEYDDVKEAIAEGLCGSAYKIKTLDLVELVMIIANSNADIWNNESFVRNREFDNFSETEQLKRLKFTHSVNDIRVDAKTKINAFFEDYPDNKVY